MATLSKKRTDLVFNKGGQFLARAYAVDKEQVNRFTLHLVQHIELFC